MRFAAALVLAGCFGKPSFSGRDATVGDDDAPIDMPMGCAPSKPSGAGLVVDTSSANARVTMRDGSVVGFASALNHYPFPDSLIVANQDLVATAEGCGYEDQIGVAAYPVFTIGSQPPGSSTHTLVPEVVGPAFTQLRTHWSVPLDSSCGAGATAIGAGSTTWGFFPDGRVVRNDTIVPTDMNTVSPGPQSCNCPGGNGVMGFVITSYTTFEATRLAAVTRARQQEQSAPLPATTTAAEGACARGTMGGAVAVWWDRPDMAEISPRPTRLRHEANPGTLHDIFAFVYDMVPASEMLTSVSAGMSFGIRTHMLLSSTSTPCTALLDTAEAFAGSQPLQIGPVGMAGSPVAYVTGGVFDDATSYTGAITIDGAQPPGFAVHLRFPGFTAVAADRDADRVVWQRQTDGTFTMVFVDGLSAGQPITVTPECPS